MNWFYIVYMLMFILGSYWFELALVYMLMFILGSYWLTHTLVSVFIFVECVCVSLGVSLRALTR